MSDEQYSTPAGQSPALGALTGAGRIGPCHFPLGAMSLRDYFAAKAMQAIILASQCEDRGLNGINSAVCSSPNKRPDEGVCAALAYRFADAMLKARK